MEVPASEATLKSARAARLTRLSPALYVKERQNEEQNVGKTMDGYIVLPSA